MTTDATVETNRPVASKYAEATHTSPQPKKLVKDKSGATLESITLLRAASNPVASPQPTIAEIIPSSRNGSWIDHEDAPTSFITPVSRRRLNAAIRRVLLINYAAVSTEARPTSSAPFLSTPSNLKNLSKK